MIDPIAGRTLTLGLGAQTCTGVTDSTGTAAYADLHRIAWTAAAVGELRR